MTGSKGILVLVFLCCLILGIIGDEEEENPGLELNFYRNSCPNAEQFVKEEVSRSTLIDPTTAAALLRIDFHDCQVDAGGPYIDVFTGRKDGKLASKERADKELPPADISVDKFIKIFQQKNITLQEGINLLGAHTLGIGHCRNFEKKLQPPGDPTLSTGFKLALLVICSNPFFYLITFKTYDLSTFEFDNRYFTDILNGRGLLKIDSGISRDQRTKPHVLEFASD